MLNFSKLALGIAIALIIPASYAASVPFTSISAPDAVARTVLSAPLKKIDEGSTPGADASPSIHRNFSQIIEQNFARLNQADATALIDGLSERELDDLAVFYNTANADTGHEDHLLPLLASRLDSTHLVRLSRHFGYAPVYTAVLKYSPLKASSFSMSGTPTDVPAVPHTLAAMTVATAATHSLLAGLGGAGGVQANASPILRYYNWTASEIYLDLRTAPVGSLGVFGAVVETGTVYYTTGVQISWAAGQTVGEGLNWLLQTYTPNLYDAIGGTIDQMYQNYQTATTLFNQGQILGSIVSAFGVQSNQSGPMSTSDGDYGTTTSYTDFTSSAGACRIDCSKPITN